MTDVVDSKKGKYTTPDGSRTWEYLAIITCSLFSFSIGTTIGWVSPTIVKFLEPGSPIPFTPEDISTMVAAAAFGHLIAPLVSNSLVDRIGRRRTLLLSGLPVIVSSAMIMIANDVWVIHIARVLVGFSLGMCLCVSPMYMGEIASVHTRGFAGSTIGVMINLGVLFSYGICPYLSIVKVAGLLMTVALIYELTFWFMPETPYYLAMMKNFDDAEFSLEKLRGRTNVSEELDIINNTMKETVSTDGGTKKSGTLRDVFANRRNRRALAISLIFLLPQHFGGYFLILMYAELIFKGSGSLIASHLATIAVGVTQLVSAVLAGLLVDKIGRKPLILIAGVVAGLANAAIGSYLYIKEYTSLKPDDYSILFLIAVLVQVFSFNCGLLSTHMVIISEIFATEVKGIGMCLVGTCSAVFSIITSKLYIALAITWNIGHSLPFIGFALITWFSTILLIFITPETKGKTFLQIQQRLNR